jgi:hypothetical protein
MGLKEIYNRAGDNNDPQQCELMELYKFYLDMAAASGRFITSGKPARVLPQPASDQ